MKNLGIFLISLLLTSTSAKAAEPVGYEAVTRQTLLLGASGSGEVLSYGAGERVIIASKTSDTYQLIAEDGTIHPISSSRAFILRSFTFAELEKQAQCFASVFDTVETLDLLDEFVSEAKAIAHLYVRRVRQNSPGTLPPPSSTPSYSSSSRPTVSITNDTQYLLYVYYTGPTTVSLAIQPHKTRTIEVSPGSYGVVAKSGSATVRSFYGSVKIQQGYDYTEKFYIVTRRV